MKNQILLLSIFISLFSCTMKNKTIDWQGHRGTRGLMPENSIPAFLKALEFEQVTTLELDLAVAKDETLIVTHEPWMSHHICNNINGEAVTEAAEDSLLIFQMTYDEIKSYDCGSRGNTRFPNQHKMKTYKPAFTEMVKAVDAYCEKNNRPKPNFNIEIKSEPSYDGIKTPGVKRFVELVLEAIKDLGIKERCNLQSFDFRVVREIKKQDASVVIALLIGDEKPVAQNINTLGFTPDIYSPYFKLLNKEVVEDLHQRGMKVIPWTVNTIEDMKAMIEIGVDGIITDYPNLIGELGE